MQRKTINLWLRALPKEVAEKAITARKNETRGIYTPNPKVKRLSEAVDMAFSWSHTPEGWAYWFRVKHNLIRLEETSPSRYGEDWSMSNIDKEWSGCYYRQKSAFA
jgi:hypothetical protein